MAKLWLAALLACVCLSQAAAQDERVLTASYPEGPLWQSETLYYAEMRADRITVIDADGERAFFVQRGCGPTAIAPYGDGFVVLCHLGRRVVAVDRAGAETRRWQFDTNGAALRNPNDVSADGRGGVYFSDPGPFAREAQPVGRVMYLSAEGVLAPVAGPLAYPNGVHVAGDALYVSEHLAGRVLRFPITARGRLGEAAVFADLTSLRLPAHHQPAYALAGPDGLEFGPDGALWVAIYGEGRLLRLSPEGAFLDAHERPTQFLTNVAFGAGLIATTGAFDNTSAQSVGEVRISAR